MRPKIINRQCLSAGDELSTFKISPESKICFDCKIPVNKCNGECKRFREEIKKLKLKEKKDVKTN